MQKISPHAAPTLELCGKGMGDGTNNVWDEDLSVSEFYYPHTADTLDLEWYSTLDEAATNESWGLRDYKLYLVDYKRDFS